MFEQNGEIRALTGKTLTLGRSDGNVTVTAQNFTANGLSYPTSDGTNGQVLATNGSGTLSFSVSSSGAYDLNGSKLTMTRTVIPTSKRQAAARQSTTTLRLLWVERQMVF